MELAVERTRERLASLAPIIKKRKKEMWQEGKRLGRRALLYSLLWQTGIKLLADGRGEPKMSQAWPPLEELTV